MRFVLTVLRKELRENLRDRRSLLSALITSAVLMPVPISERAATIDIVPSDWIATNTFGFRTAPLAPAAVAEVPAQRILGASDAPSTNAPVENTPLTNSRRLTFAIEFTRLPPLPP